MTTSDLAAAVAIMLIYIVATVAREQVANLYHAFASARRPTERPDAGTAPTRQYPLTTATTGATRMYQFPKTCGECAFVAHRPPAWQ